MSHILRVQNTHWIMLFYKYLLRCQSCVLVLSIILQNISCSCFPKFTFSHIAHGQEDRYPARPILPFTAPGDPPDIFMSPTQPEEENCFRWNTILRNFHKYVYTQIIPHIKMDRWRKPELLSFSKHKVVTPILTKNIKINSKQNCPSVTFFLVSMFTRWRKVHLLPVVCLLSLTVTSLICLETQVK